MVRIDFSEEDIPPRFTRKPEMDKRIARGDDFAGDAWIDRETGGVVVPPKRKMQRNGEIKAFDVETTITPEYSIDVNVWEYLVGKASGDEGMGEHSAYFPERLAIRQQPATNGRN